jgi:thiamine transport system substrate-binding protein
MRVRTLALVLAVVLLAAACGDDDDAPGAGGAPPESEPASGVVTLLAHDSWVVSDTTVDAFTAETGLTLEVLQPGDAVAVVNRAILSRESPEADVLFGIDNNVLSRAFDADLFVPYEASGLDHVPAGLRMDDEHRVTPIDTGDVCINVDRSWFADAGLAPPATLADLADPAYDGLLVVENPADSTPGLAFMAATIAEFGEDGWLDYWSGLRANDVEVVSGWEDAYYGSFTVGSGGEGDRPLVVSYASSPPAEVIFADPRPAEAPTTSLLDSCYRQVEFAGILANAGNEAGARALIDFMLGLTYQEDLPLNQFVFPARSDATLPEEFVEFAEVPESPLQLDPATVEAHREEWLDEWTDTVLR